MKFTVRIKKKHLAKLRAQVPGIDDAQRLFELALELGLSALTATERGRAPKA